MFDVIGYFREYYIGSKFIGTVICEKDRETIGYEGQQKEILTELLILTNGKKIKKGTEVKTLLYPLNGKISK